MPPQDLPPGLYDHPLSESSHQALSQLPPEMRQLSALDPAEAPQRLARYLRQLSEIALASLPEAERQQRQLTLVNELVALLRQQVPRAVEAGDQLHPSAQLLQEIRDPDWQGRQPSNVITTTTTFLLSNSHPLPTPHGLVLVGQPQADLPAGD